jgi:hypothetical protein
VRFAALIRAPLVGGGGSNGLFAEGKVDLIQSTSHFITPGYFSVINNQLKAGRTFTDADIREAEFVMIINETLARTAFGDATAIGKRISCCEGGPGKPHWQTVVGVVADIKTRGPAQPALPSHLPLMQIPDVAWTWTAGRRSTRGDDIAAMTGAIRNAVKELDSTLPVFRIWTMEEGCKNHGAGALQHAADVVARIDRTRFAALGIYSAIAWLVAQRGRSASHGARRVEATISMISLHGLKPVVAGLAIGFAGAIGRRGCYRTSCSRSGRAIDHAVATAMVLLMVAAIAYFRRGGPRRSIRQPRYGVTRGARRFHCAPSARRMLHQPRAAAAKR